MLRNSLTYLTHLVSLLAFAHLAGPRCSGADYLRDIKPLLAHKCYACHAALKQQSGLRLDTGASLIQGGDSGAAITPGKPEASLLIDVLTGDAGFSMPPESEGTPLTSEEIELVRQWIAAGASVPSQEAPQADPASWWSYHPITRPQLPQVANREWCRTPVDYFVAAERELQGLSHVGEASKLTWLRRVYLDLIGLPPTPAEQSQFLADTGPTAYDTVVDDLLSRPQYGERWGRHWMDIWRYSDWYGSRSGNEIRYSQRHIWRWRDWIIDSLNDDESYAQMVREMLAGDELCGDDGDVLPATGYLGRNWYKFDRDAWLFETVERTGEAFLGLTFRCCRCHDHKFDPVTQEEYYRFRAIFEPHDVRTDPISAFTETERDATLGDVLRDGIALVYDKSPESPTFLLERGDSRRADKSRSIQPGVPAALGGTFEVRPIKLPTTMWYPLLRPTLRETLVCKAQVDVDSAESNLRQAIIAAEDVSHTRAAEFSELEVTQLADSKETLERKYRDATRAVSVAQAARDLAAAKLTSLEKRIAAEVARYFCTDGAPRSQLARAAAAAEANVQTLQAKLEVVQAADKPEQLAQAQTQLAAARRANDHATDAYSPLGEQFPQTSSGRRKALAEWICSSDNPRTARVAANHLWGRHFGQPLVATTENFGLNGDQPTHPLLLDWLASELIAHDWKMKPLHRQLVLSATYRMATSPLMTSWIVPNPQDAVANAAVSPATPQGGGLLPAAQIDPQNRWLWRMNSRRMEAEVVRDSVLHLASKLDMTMGGPEIPESEGEATLRRSLYFRNTPNEKMLMMEVFDVADPNACYRRVESIVPHQSLAMLNSGLTQDAARKVAGQISDDADFITAAFATILARQPSPLEKQRCESFLQQHIQLLKNEAGRRSFPAGGSSKLAPASEATIRAKENLILVLFSHNDFVTIR